VIFIGNDIKIIKKECKIEKLEGNKRPKGAAQWSAVQILWKKECCVICSAAKRGTEAGSIIWILQKQST
jgi:hypothetical protein